MVVAICAMELATKSGFVESRDVPPAFDIIRELLRICITSHFWSVIGETMYQFSIGLAISVAIGIPLGLAIGANDLLWRALRPTIEFLRPVPPVAFLALLLLQYGPSAKSAIRPRPPPENRFSRPRMLLPPRSFWMLLTAAELIPGAGMWVPSR